MDLGRAEVGTTNAESDNVVIWSDPPPHPRTRFEAEVIRELEALVRGLPTGTARLRIGRLKAAPGLLEPDFEITPTNPKAARLSGYAVADDLNLAVDHAEQEFFGFGRGGTVVRGASWQEELSWIWEVVIAGGFTQRHYFDRHGKRIAGCSKILVRGAELVFHSGRREGFFRRGYSRVEEVIYEPFIPDSHSN